MLLQQIIKDPPFMWYPTGIHLLQALARCPSSTLELKWVDRQRKSSKLREKKVEKN